MGGGGRLTTGQRRARGSSQEEAIGRASLWRDTGGASGGQESTLDGTIHHVQQAPGAVAEPDQQNEKQQKQKHRQKQHLRLPHVFGDKPPDRHDSSSPVPALPETAHASPSNGARLRSRPTHVLPPPEIMRHPQLRSSKHPRGRTRTNPNQAMRGDGWHATNGPASGSFRAPTLGGTCSALARGSTDVGRRQRRRTPGHPPPRGQRDTRPRETFRRGRGGRKPRGNGRSARSLRCMHHAGAAIDSCSRDSPGVSPISLTRLLAWPHPPDADSPQAIGSTGRRGEGGGESAHVWKLSRGE